MNYMKMISYSGNHERDWPGSGSFYENKDSGGECGVLAETMFYVPAENRAKFWYIIRKVAFTTPYFRISYLRLFGSSFLSKVKLP